MRFYRYVSYHMNKGIYWQRHKEEFLVDTMDVVLPLGRFFMQGFGGPLFIMM